MTLASHRPPALGLVSSLSKDANVLVIGLADQRGTDVLLGLPAATAKAVAKRLGAPLLQVAQQLGATSKLGTATIVPGDLRIVVVGLGAVDVTPPALRQAAGTAVRAAGALPGTSPLKVAVSLDASDPELVRAVAEGALLGAYTYAKVTGSPKPARVTAIEIISSTTKGVVNDAVNAATVVAASTCLARDWINTPANLLYPETFAAEAREAVKGLRSVSIEVLDDKQLAARGYGGLTAVGGGSTRGPRLVRIDYAPRGASRTLALVGKGITFDSGGLDIKTPEGMYTMKCDMSGAAAVLAAVQAIATLGLKVHVIAYATMAENMPSGSAYRPSDVLTMYGGMTVENVNSDAEGRLVMADALYRTREDCADVVVDVATLTGACMVALGLRTAGLMASDDATADLLLDAAESAGEDLWQLPIPDAVRHGLDSKVADLKSGGSRYGGALTAGAFLQRFVADDQAWAHLDIAGPAFNDDAFWGHVPVGGTGFAVATLVSLARSMQG